MFAKPSYLLVLGLTNSAAARYFKYLTTVLLCDANQTLKFILGRYHIK